MARYLVAFVHTFQAETQLFPQVYKLKHACTPDEVTLPKNTVHFLFLRADIDSTEELQEAFLGFRVGIMAAISCSVPYEIENDKHYFVGKLKTVNGEEGIYNAEAHTFIPSSYLRINNYEVIDL